MDFSGFDWDHGNSAKCLKHGVSFSEIEAIFQTHLVFSTDPNHSLAEKRFRAVGTGAGGRNVFVVFTLRHRGDETFIRPVSARYMHKKEIVAYEKALSRLQNG